MGARKGQNNFKGAQRKKVDTNERLIKHALGSIKKGTIFTNENALIVYVAEKTKLNRTTVKRNPVYLRLILEYFSLQAGAAGLISDKEANSAILRIKLLAERARSKNLEVENYRVNRAIGRLLGEKSSQIGQMQIESVNSASEGTTQVLDIAFTSTAMTLLALLERLGEKQLGITLDPHKKQILDNSEVGAKRIIAGPERTRWFFDLLATHPSLGS
jgi:hypothetical protein